MKRKIKEKKLKVVWKWAEGVSEEESQRILDKVFDILLSEEPLINERDDGGKLMNSE